MMESGMKMILNALEVLLQSIPQYEAPEVLENGDIIIRRVQPKDNNKKPEKNDETET